MLAKRFKNPVSVRSDLPLSDAQIRQVAPSIFAAEAHGSRSERYTYIPTSEVLQGLRREGFSPFMACQTRCRHAGRREHTKHLLRLRHASQIAAGEANEIVLLNSHDGSSCYQMLSGVFRFVCANGMVCGETQSDVRVRHAGNVVENVIAGAFQVLQGFAAVDAQRDHMKALFLNPGEQAAFAHAALALKYANALQPAPVSAAQLLQPRRPEDAAGDLWTTLNRVQENLVRGGLPGRSGSGRQLQTRAVQAIDSNIRLNRALWLLAEEMRRLKA